MRCSNATPVESDLIQPYICSLSHIKERQVIVAYTQISCITMLTPSNTILTMNVLLLEDEPDLSAVACEQIESRGHKVFPALDIAHAKSILQDDSVDIDILIADQMVPDGNGSLFAIQTKGDGLSVVVVSGQLSSTDVEQLEAHGVDYYHKPSLYSDIVEDLIRKNFPESV